MSKRMIRLLVKRVKPQSGQLSSVHVDAVMRLARQADSGKYLRLPGGVEVRHSREWLVFRAAIAQGERRMRWRQNGSNTRWLCAMGWRMCRSWNNRCACALR